MARGSSTSRPTPMATSRGGCDCPTCPPCCRAVSGRVPHWAYTGGLIRTICNPATCGRCWAGPSRPSQPRNSPGGTRARRPTCSWCATRQRRCSPTASSSRRIPTPISRPRHGGGRALGVSMRQKPNDIQCDCTARKLHRGRGRLWSAVTLWALLVCLLPGTAPAGKRDTPVRIGVLTASWGPPPGVVGLIEGLEALGYRENEDFVIGIRFTRGDSAVLHAVARDLVRGGVDILFCIGESEAKAAQQATTTRPIVFIGAGDPVGQGLIQSYARPGGNITGVTDLNTELSAKRLELFQELIPGLKRVLFPYHAHNAHQAASAMQYRAAAQRLGIELVERKLRMMEEARDALAGVQKAEIDGMLAPRDVDLNIPGFVL